jgi:hypothetical protein
VHVSESFDISRVRKGKQGEKGTAYLDLFECPGLDVPLALGDTADVVVDEEAFGLDFEDETVGDFADAGDELGDGFGKEVVEEIDRFDDDLVGISCGVRAAPRCWWCCAAC